MKDAPAPSSGSIRAAWGTAAGVALVVAIVFAPALKGEFVNYDDDLFIVNNPGFKGLSAEHLRWMFTDLRGLYIPLTWFSLAVDYSVWGLDPVAFHATNVALHAANAALLFWLLITVFGAHSPAGIAGAAAGALLFALHPQRVESVAWVSERRDVLFGFFLLLSLLAYVHGAGKSDGRRWGWLAASVIAYLASLLSKGMGMTFPVLLLIVDSALLRRKIDRGVLLEKIPFMVLGVATAVVAWQAQHIGQAAQATHYTVLHRIMQPPYRLTLYVGTMIWPVGLSPLVPFDPVESQTSGKFLASAAGVLGGTVGLFLLRRHLSAVWPAWIAFIVLLAPTLGMVLQVGPHAIADRNTYAPGMVWAVTGAFAVRSLMGNGSRTARAGLGLMVLVPACWGVLTRGQIGIWENSVQLWTRAIECSPDDYFAWYNRAQASASRGDHASARRDMDRCGALNPGFAAALRGQARRLSRRGEQRHQQGDPDGAWRDFDESIRIDPFHADGYRGRSVIRMERKDLSGALTDLDCAVRIDPGAGVSYMDRGNILRRVGRMNEALLDLEEGTRLLPGVPEAWANLGLAYQEAGRREESIAAYRRTLEVAPPDWPYRADVERDLREVQGKGGAGR